MTQISSQALGRYIDTLLQNPDIAGTAAGGDFALLFALPLATAMEGEGKKTTPLLDADVLPASPEIIEPETIEIDAISAFFLGGKASPKDDEIVIAPGEDMPELDGLADTDLEAIANPMMPVFPATPVPQTSTEDVISEGEYTPVVTLDPENPEGEPFTNNKNNTAMAKPPLPADDAAAEMEFGELVDVSRQARLPRGTASSDLSARETAPDADDTLNLPAATASELRPRRRSEARQFQLVTSDMKADEGRNMEELVTRTRSLAPGQEGAGEGVRSPRIDRPTVSSSSDTSLAPMTRTPHQPIDRNPAATAGQTNAFASSDAGETMLDFMKRDWQEKLGARLSSSLQRGEQEIDLQLHPKSLGKLRISLAMTEGDVRVKVMAESSLTASLLADAEGRLASSLEQSGLRMSQFTATWSGERQSQDSPAHQRGKSAQKDEKNNPAGAETIHDDTDLVNSARNVHPSGVNVTA